MKSGFTFFALSLLLALGIHAFSPKSNVRETTGRQATTSWAAKKRTQTTPAHHDGGRWQQRFDQLVKYRESHGDANPDGGDLAEWLDEQKRQHHLLMKGLKTRITRKRAAALESIGAIGGEADSRTEKESTE